jgi:hypothetical protein
VRRTERLEISLGEMMVNPSFNPAVGNGNDGNPLGIVLGNPLAPSPVLLDSPKEIRADP